MIFVGARKRCVHLRDRLILSTHNTSIRQDDLVSTRREFVAEENIAT